MRSLLLPTLLLPLLALACSSTVEEDSGTGGSTTSGTGGATGSIGATGSTSTGAGSPTTTASSSSSGSTSGTGGGMCAGYVDVSEDGGPMTSLSASCPGEWDSGVSATAYAFIEQGGAPGTPALLNIVGCASTGPGKLVLSGVMNHLSSVPLLQDSYTSGSVAYTDASGASYDTSDSSFNVGIDVQIQQGAVNLIEGDFMVEAGNGGNTLAHTLAGTFQVCVLASEDNP